MTLNEPTPCEVGAELIERGYQRGKVQPHEAHNAYYFRPSGVNFAGPDDDQMRGQLDVRRWDLDGDLWSSYEVGATFSTPLGWLTMKFYGLCPPEFLARLTELEERVCQAQALWIGRP